MKRFQSYTLSLACMLAVASAFAAPTNPEPLIDTPLRDPAITRAPDGRYFLTGTIASETKSGTLDFLNNDGQWMGTLFGNNRYAPVRGRLVIFPLEVEWDGTDLSVQPQSNGENQSP